MNRNHKPTRWLQAKVGLAALGACLLASHEADAEVTVAKGETWDAYVAGRVGVFASYAFGQGRPIPKVPMSSIEPGGGVDTDDPTLDTIYDQYDDTGLQPAKDANGNPLAQGKFDKMRVRSGYYP